MATFAALALLLCSAAGAEDVRGYDKSQGGYEYVLLGEYPYEEDGATAPVVWRVLSVQEGRALLLSEMILDTKQVTFVEDEKDRTNHNYPDLTDFRDSDLSKWLNGEMLDTLLGGDPLLGAVIETEQGRLWLLSYEQMSDTKMGFDKSVWNHNMRSRRAVATPYAKAGGILVDRSLGTSPWWSGTLRNKTGKKGWIAGVDGHISVGFFGRTNVGVRPALTIDLTLCKLLSGAGTQDDPFVLGAKTAASRPAFALLASAGASDVALRPSSGGDAETEVVLSFVGDLSIGDATQSRQTANSLTNVINQNGYAYPFSLVDQYFHADDYTFGNLEVNFTTQERLKSKNKYNMIGQPDFVNVLIEGGFDVVNTVNNHCMDFTEAGYQDTLKTLDDAGFNHFGTIYPGMPRESDILGVADVKGIRIGMVGFSYPDEKRDLKKYVARIEKLKNEMGCDLVVCSMHWGREEHMTSMNTQYSFAKKLVDAGADIIWGHHPHVLQPVMFYQGKPLMFSTGNFIFGTMGNVDPSTGIFQLVYHVEDGKPVLTQMRVVPCQTGKKGDYRPYELTDPAERTACWKKMISKKKISKLDNLPASFAETGIVNIAADGTLLDAE